MKSPRTRVSSASGSQAIVTARIARRTTCGCPARINPSRDSRWYGGAHSNGTPSAGGAALISRRRSRARPTPWRGRLWRLCRRALALLLLDIPLEEVVEEGSDDRDRTDASDGLPAGADGGLDDIGRQLQGESRDQPAGVAQPRLAGNFLAEGLEARARDADGYLDGADEYHEQRDRVDQGDRRFTDDDEPLSHARYSSPGVLPRTAVHRVTAISVRWSHSRQTTRRASTARCRASPATHQRDRPARSC